MASELLAYAARAVRMNGSPIRGALVDAMSWKCRDLIVSDAVPVFVLPFQVAEALSATGPPWMPWMVIVNGTPDALTFTAAAGDAVQLNVAFAVSSTPLESIALA